MFVEQLRLHLKNATFGTCIAFYIHVPDRLLGKGNFIKKKKICVLDLHKKGTLHIILLFYSLKVDLEN